MFRCDFAFVLLHYILAPIICACRDYVCLPSVPPKHFQWYPRQRHKSGWIHLQKWLREVITESVKMNYTPTNIYWTQNYYVNSTVSKMMTMQKRSSLCYPELAHRPKPLTEPPPSGTRCLETRHAVCQHFVLATLSTNKYTITLLSL